jgi:hypothetical protein
MRLQNSLKKFSDIMDKNFEKLHHKNQIVPSSGDVSIDTSKKSTMSMMRLTTIKKIREKHHTLLSVRLP